MRSGSSVRRNDLMAAPRLPYPYGLASGKDPGERPGKQVRPDPLAGEREDLPYKVELWNEARQAVEQVLAVTANASIGYAAYYAATREHPLRYITLKHKNSVMSRWNGPDH